MFELEVSCPLVASRIPFMSMEAGEDRLREYKKLQDACLRVKIRPTTGDSCIKIGLNVVLNHEPTDVRSKRSVPSSKIL